MATETERKFLVKNDNWKKIPKDDVITIVQGYLAKSKNVTVRVRIANDKAYLTVKGKRINLSCPEYEYKIPMTDAQEMLKMSVTPLIEKTRHVVNQQGITWEIDVFKGINEGLVMVEVEFESAEHPPTVMGRIPDWIGNEVSYDKRYTNTYIAEHLVPHSG